MKTPTILLSAALLASTGCADQTLKKQSLETCHEQVGDINKPLGEVISEIKNSIGVNGGLPFGPKIPSAGTVEHCLKYGGDLTIPNFESCLLINQNEQRVRTVTPNQKEYYVSDWQLSDCYDTRKALEFAYKNGDIIAKTYVKERNSED